MSLRFSPLAIAGLLFALVPVLVAQGPAGLPAHPLERAVDTDGDGVISAEEIAAATAALKALDRNGDGQLTLDEIEPPRRGGGPPPVETSEAAAQQPAPTVLNALPTERKISSFGGNVKVSVSGVDLLVESDGIPTHPTDNFPTAYNPNRILKQDYHFRIPLEPKFAAKPTTLPFGPIGVAINGIPFYNPYNAQGRDAVMGPNAELFDSCCGHPDQMGRYHYHKYPICTRSPFHDEPGQHSPLLGWAFDGFALYGPNGENGQPPTDLDTCNGHIDAMRGYHYHVTQKFPYLLGAYRGVVEMANFSTPRGLGAADGPPGKWGSKVQSR
jgi:hypothetical protein